MIHTPPCRPHVLAGNDYWFRPEADDQHSYERATERAARIREAKAICSTCPYTDACLQAAINEGHKVGIWGGTTTTERPATTKPDRTPAPCGTRAAASRHRRNREPLDDACREAERAQSRERNAKRAAKREAA